MNNTPLIALAISIILMGASTAHVQRTIDDEPVWHSPFRDLDGGPVWVPTWRPE